MAQLLIHADSLARLQGFLAGVAWINDGAVTLVSLDPATCRAAIEDRDAETDASAHLGPDGLIWSDTAPSPSSPAVP